MIQLAQENWPLLLAAFLIGLLVAWLILKGSRKTVVRRDESVADDAPARRNQALIDSTPVAAGATGGAQVAASARAETVQATDSEPAPAPAKAAAVSASTTGSAGDDLTRIKGVGPKLAATLGSMGVTTLDQIAAWTDEDVARIDAQLGRFQGRIERDDWRTQAALLSTDDTAGYEQKFGRL